MLTPNEAAKRVGVSRPTIMNALKKRELFGVRNNRNHWQIAPEDLDKWCENRDANHTLSLTDSSLHADTRVQEAERELTELKGTVGILNERLAGKDALIDQLRSDLEHARLPFWKKVLGRKAS